MSNVRISYFDALRGIISSDDIEGVVGLVEGHKNWGAFSAKIPSYIIVSLVDAVRRLKEEQLPSFPDPEDLGEKSDE